jgi:putative DNA methylase
MKKKLIEVALPLEAINVASAREKSIRHGHPSTLHLWWARRPLAAARAVIFAQMVDDPSGNPDLFPTEKAQDKERQRLFRLMEELVKWENTTNESILQAATNEIWQSWRRACAENVDHPRAKELFNRYSLPAFHDPFAGGGALPLEAQRLGLEAYASDLNPVAVLINKAMIEIPPRFAGRPPVNPECRKDKSLFQKKWTGAEGLAEDVGYYGKWMCEEAKKRIGHLYPNLEVTPDLARERTDLRSYVGKKLTVIAWLWVRTVKSPNPAFADVDVPLATTFFLSTKQGRETYVEPLIENGGYRFTVKVGKPKNAEAARNGTKLSRGANFQCLMSGTPIPVEYIRREGMAGRLGARLMATIAEGENGKLFIAPTETMELVARKAKPEWKPDIDFFQQALGFRIGNYGMSKWSDLFTPRQTVALTTFSDLALEAREQIRRDAQGLSWADEKASVPVGSERGINYSDAVTTYLACAISRASDYWGTGAIWEPSGGFIAHVFTRNALPMTWDYPEANPFSDGSGSWEQTCIDWVERYVRTINPKVPGKSIQADAQTQTISAGRVVSTDPPYFDNIGYADLSDYFYVWLRRSLRPVLPELFATLTVPKIEELVATPDRHGGKQNAEVFFLKGMTQAMHRIAEQSHPAFPVTIYYAFRQAETDDEEGTSSTGWETFLDAVIKSGFALVGTWPIRTERPGRIRETGSNALASSIVIVCRPLSVDAASITRREFITALKVELPLALKHLQRGNIAPVDLAQAAIGPGMGVYSRYAAVLDAAGKPLTVKEALTLINQTLDEALAEQEGDFDAESRWALIWFERSGFSDGEYGVAETLSKAKNTSVGGMAETGILVQGRGKVRLLRPSEMEKGWDPQKDGRLTVWGMVHQLIRALESGGESSAAALVAKLGQRADTARELAYRLYAICERKKRAQEALSYNALVQSWPELLRIARESTPASTEQTRMFDQE